MTMLPYDRNLVDTADIAKLLGVTREHVTGRIIKKPDFPKPIINLSRRIRKWRADDVLTYIKKHNV